LKKRDSPTRKEEALETKASMGQKKEELSTRPANQDSSGLYQQLINLREFILSLDSLNSELPVLACAAIYDLEQNDSITHDNIIFAFSRVYGHLRPFFRELILSIPALSLFSIIQELEIFVLQSKLTDGNIMRLTLQLGSFHNVTHHFDEIAGILQILREIEPFNLTLKLQEILVPLGLLLRVITAMNDFIKTSYLARRYDFLSIDFPNCRKRMTLMRYERSSLHRLNPIPHFDEFLQTCCAEIESDGIPILLSNDCQFHLAQIIAPNISFSLIRLHELLENIPSLSQFREDLIQQPLAGSVFFGAEQTLAKLDGYEESLDILRQFRRIHHFFLALDYRKIISYSNAVMLMYFRTFVAQLCNEDYLAEQPLIIPIEPDLLIKINHELKQGSSAANEHESVMLRFRLEALENPELYTAFFFGKIDDCELPESIRDRLAQVGETTADNDSIKTFVKDVIATEIRTTSNSSILSSYAVDYVSLHRLLENNGLIEQSIPICLEDFELVFPVHFSSLRLLDLNSILAPIERNFGAFCEENSEHYSLLSHLKRGCLSSETVGRLTCISKKDVMKSINLMIIFLDFIDQIASQSPHLQGRSLLREMNIKNFCGSMVNRFLFLNSASRMELPSVISQLRSIAHHPEISSIHHLQGLFTPILRECISLDKELCISLTNRFKKSPDDNIPLLDLTFGCLNVEIRSFLAFIQDPTRRFCHPSGAFLLSTDLQAVQPQIFAAARLTIPRPSFPVSFTLLDVETQDGFVCYLQRLQTERESLVAKELEMQQTIEQRTAIRDALIEVKSQRVTLLDHFLSLRNSVTSAVHHENDSFDMEEPVDRHETREEKQIALKWKERRLAVLKEHCEIIGEKLEIATEMEKQREWGRLQKVTEEAKVETVDPKVVKEKKKRIDTSPPAILPEVLAEHMRPWNTVSTQAVESKSRSQRSDTSDREIGRLRRRLRNVNAAIANFKF
jgi:hypothetical protein